MDIRDYCDSMYAELTGMKAKVYDILRVIERMPREERAKIRFQTDELQILVGDLSRRIDRLMQECPADWSKAKMEIEELERPTGGKDRLVGRQPYCRGLPGRLNEAAPNYYEARPKEAGVFPCLSHFL